MPVYANQFGAVQTAYIAYVSYDLSTPLLQLSWPTSYQDSPNVVAAYMEFTNTDATPNPQVQLPDATQVSVGQNFIASNLGSDTIFLLDGAGNEFDSIPPPSDTLSNIKYYILVDNSTIAGVWHIVTFGAGTSKATAAQLAGYGLNSLIIGTSDGTKLNTQINPTILDNSLISYNIQPTDYTSLLVWTAATGNIYLPATNSSPIPPAVPPAYYVAINNAGTGIITVSSSESGIGIQGELSIDVAPQQTLILISCGTAQTINGRPTKWFTLGFGQESTVGITYLNIPVAGNSSIYLTTSQVSNEILEFSGTLTGNIFVYFPNVQGQWSLYNNTMGDFTLTIQLVNPIGTPYEIPQGNRAIFYSNALSLFNIPEPSGTGNVTFIPPTPTSAGIIATYADTTGLNINASSVNIGTLTPTLSLSPVTAIENLNAISFAESGNGLLMLGSQVGMEIIEQNSEVCAIFNGGLPTGGLSTINTLVEIRSPLSTPMALQLSQLTTPLPTPLSGGAGLIAFNLSVNEFQGYNGTEWVTLGGSSVLPASGIIVTDGSGSPSAVSNLVDTSTDVYATGGNLLLGLEITSGGNSNTGFGFQALAVNVGQYNSAFGYQALANNQNGTENTALGLFALAENQTGSQNTACGQGALSRITSGNHNTAIGQSAGDQYTEYDYCVFVGAQANANNGNLQYSIAMGYQSAVGSSQAIVIGGQSIVGENGGGSEDTNSIIVGYNSQIGTNDGGPGTSNSIILGANSYIGHATDEIDNSIGIGCNINIEVANKLVLGNNCAVGIGTFASDSALQIVAQTNADAWLHIGAPNAAPASTSSNDTIIYNNVASSTGFLAVMGSQGYSSGNLVTAKTNVTAGTATLTAGAMTVMTTAVQANSIILVNYNMISGVGGSLSAPAAGRSVGVSFTINSTIGTDTSTVDWVIINPL
jgi:hypothetical protein